MSKVDWSLAPEGAEFYARGFRKLIDGFKIPVVWTSAYWTDGGYTLDECKKFSDYEQKPTEWPAEARADAIAQNGATGEHYQVVGISEMIEAQDFLSEGLKILGERGRQYGSNERECSFSQVAQAFNAITGNELKGSDICLVLALVKQVRQYAQPERFHEDSAVDGVNYTALQAQELKKERK